MGRVEQIEYLYDTAFGDVAVIIRQEQFGKITPSDAVAKIHRILMNLDVDLSVVRQGQHSP